MPERTRVAVLELYEMTDVPENLMEFVVWLRSVVDLVPMEHRGTAKIEFFSTYHGDHVGVEVSYERLATPDEIEANAANRERLRREFQERRNAV